MRFFRNISKDYEDSIFYVTPRTFNRDNDKEVLSYALGAALYTPGSRINLVKNIQKYSELMSEVICLEDSIGDNEVELAEKNIIDQLLNLNDMISKNIIDYNDIPLIFIRIRDKVQMKRLINVIDGAYKLITGFVFPKFSYNNGYEYFEELKKLNNAFNKKFYAMPILESEEIMYKDLRYDNLNKINKILIENKDLVLNIRIGGADFSRLFGIRRSKNTPIYNISVVNDCIADIINIFSRKENDFVISGPVWEYFNGMNDEFDYLNFMANFDYFDYSYTTKNKFNMIDIYTLGLIRETILDKENGLIGKTVIHPNQINPVQSVYIVSYEEYMDAVDILKNSEGDLGVLKSSHTNKMNEIKTHYNWALKIINRSKIYGVYNEKEKRKNMLA
jgi:citrate lyase beta subunit